MAFFDFLHLNANQQPSEISPKRNLEVGGLIRTPSHCIILRVHFLLLGNIGSSLWVTQSDTLTIELNALPG